MTSAEEHREGEYLVERAELTFHGVQYIVNVTQTREETLSVEVRAPACV